MRKVITNLAISCFITVALLLQSMTQSFTNQRGRDVNRDVTAPLRQLLQITVEPRPTVTSLLRPLFCGPAKRPYISLKKPRLMRSPVIHDQRTHFKISNSRISCHFTPLIRPLVQNLENLNVLCHYGPQVMKFERAPIIRSPR